MLAPLIEWSLIIFVAYVVVFQICLPLITNTPVFPMFSNKRGNELRTKKVYTHQVYQNKQAEKEIAELEELINRNFDEEKYQEHQKSKTVDLGKEEDNNGNVKL